MLKSEYLNDENVSRFVVWLRERLETSDFAHSYVNRLSNTKWQCSSLFDAFTQYNWRSSSGNDFNANALALTGLQERLEAALQENDDERTCEAAVDVMRWGGVVAGNVRWLRSNQNGLAQTLKSIRDALNSGNDSDERLTAPELRFNAGMTKVYSLICNSLLIYDSRVAAAITLAVMKYCQAQKMSSVPTLLQFPWAPAKEATTSRKPKCRNPSQGEFCFPKLAAGPTHAFWNLRASWLLEAVLAGSESRFAGESISSSLRALEAALFMIGYDLTDSLPESQESVIGEIDDDQWIACTTHGKGVEFFYRIENAEIKTKGRENPDSVTTFNEQEINEILFVLWREFGHSPFPLSNNVIHVPAGTAQSGLGSIYYQVTGKSSANTSRLAAILEDQCVFIPCNQGNLHWALDVSALGLNEDSKKVGIRPYLNSQSDSA